MNHHKIELVDDWYILYLSKNYSYNLKHSCKSWKKDNGALPTAGNGPHYRTMPYCPNIKRYWCRYCGEVATQAATDLALLAKVVDYNLVRPIDDDPEWGEW